MASYIKPLDKSFWENEINSETKMFIKDFLSQERLSIKTIKQYDSAIKIFARWVHEKYGPEKRICDLKPRDARQYQDWLVSKGLGDSAVRTKRSTVSAFFDFIASYYYDEPGYEHFKQLYTKAVKNVTNEKKKEKDPLTKAEFEKLVSHLKDKDEKQKLAYLLFTYSTGCRREESRQILKEVADYSLTTDRKGNVKNFYTTHPVRAKGKGKVGKVRTFKFKQDAMEAIKDWVEYRKTLVEIDDCEHLFVSKKNGKFQQLSPNSFNNWCTEFGELIGKKVHPHLIRSTRATIAVVEEGMDIKKVQKMLGHNNSETTQIYVVQEEEDDDDLY